MTLFSCHPCLWTRRSCVPSPGIREMLANTVSRNPRPATPRLSQIGWIALVLVGMSVSLPRALASVGTPQGVWLVDNEVAIQVFDCSNLLCGRVLWLSIPRDPQGRLVLDKKNPEPALRQRSLCGLTIFWGLRPDGPDRWTDG